ncbi:TIGR00730 family Rossman fold protein [Sporolactobacillus shoreae]|uniref:Cytokinin riboside 5'-monophosphate phosphoribohydrolase n=1 Tax=Sporolactobacillus shoreae TaxID=1465501 RepID=A0A4Z0GPG6_9BACL|nr:TIGR00730 family Rossman fold protein [Sporolactobacillus shoreae]TGA97821.1 TIGR00730 family Rossman fold protein [Sporolactobacillus shoreae]
MSKTICIYAGSNLGNDPEYAAGALKLGDAIARKGWGLIYGGSSIGLMGIIADRVLEKGGEVTGVMPKGLVLGEMAHTHLTRLLEVDSMHARKDKMNELSDGFIALPGGIGTFDELFEILCWAQIGIHHKPIGLLNAAGYFDSLLTLIQHSIDHEFANQSNLDLLCVSDNPDELLDKMAAYIPPDLGNKWRQLAKGKTGH